MPTKHTLENLEKQTTDPEFRKEILIHIRNVNKTKELVVDEHDLRLQAVNALGKLQKKYKTAPKERMHHKDLDEFHSIIKQCSQTLIKKPFSVKRSVTLLHEWSFPGTSSMSDFFDEYTGSNVYRFEHGLIDVLYKFFGRAKRFSLYLDEVLAIIDTFKSKKANVCVPSMHFMIEHYVENDVTKDKHTNGYGADEPHPHAVENIRTFATYCTNPTAWKIAGINILASWLWQLYKTRRFHFDGELLEQQYKKPMYVLVAYTPQKIQWEDIEKKLDEIVWPASEEFLLETKRIFEELHEQQRKNAARRIQKALWKRVQQRQSNNAAHELYGPGGRATQQAARFWAHPELRNKHEKYLASLQYQ